ncbi:MAG: SgcJ/EcaC family oxidoreductase [Gammaproteobacteria bacterium]
MKTTLFIALLLTAGTASAATMPTSHAHATSKTLIAKQFDIWNSALKTGNPEKVAALYCQPGGVLLPTVSNQVRSTHSEIVDYFEHFLKSKPVGHIDKSFIRILGHNAAINSGIYTFHLVQNDKPVTVQARYTFVYERRHGSWCIMDHHSSAMPESMTK